MMPELRQCPFVLGLVRRRVPDTLKVVSQPRQGASAHVGAKRSDPCIGIDRKDEVFTVFHHAVYNRLHNRVAGVEKDMVGPNP
jgi:hypothetical protein